MKLRDADFRHTEPTWAKNERIRIHLITGLGSTQISVPLTPHNLWILWNWDYIILILWKAVNSWRIEDSVWSEVFKMLLTLCLSVVLKGISSALGYKTLNFLGKKNVLYSLACWLNGNWLCSGLLSALDNKQCISHSLSCCLVTDEVPCFTLCKSKSSCSLTHYDMMYCTFRKST